MIVINERPATAMAPELLARLRRIPPALIGHLLTFGFMDGALRPIGRRKFTVCGPVVTVKTIALDNTVVHKAIDLAQAGDVLVIDRSGDTKHACWGEMTSLAAKVRGLAATIIDGPVTDAPEIEDMGYLVFSRGVAPITTRSLALAGEINTVVQCGGVAVAPGDIVLADDNGILVLAPEHVAALVEQCEPRLARDPATRQRLLAGEPISEISGANQKLSAALATQAAH